MYTDFDLWKNSIETGREILSKKMVISQQVKVIMSAFSEGNLHLEANRKANHYYALTWQETLRTIEIKNRIINQKIINRANK